MSQITKFAITSGPGSGTVQSVSGGNNITITGTPTVNPIVNVSGTTNHAVQVGNALGALTSIPVGLTGQVLTGVTGADPVFAAAPASGISTLTGNTGGPVSPTLGNVNVVTANSTVEFTGAASTLTLDFGLTNLFLGTTGAITAGTQNVAMGFSAGALIDTGLDNVFIGYQCAPAVTDGTDNVAIGNQALLVAGTGTVQNIAIGSQSLVALTTFGQDNTAVGAFSLNNLLTGITNIAIGADAGAAYTSSESNNICIGSLGVVADSGVTRIGTNRSQTTCFIAGIDAVDLSTANIVTEAGDQLGTAVLTAGTNITITPGVNTITIDATGGGGGGPAFMASLTATDVGVTGDGTQYQIVYDTTIFDVGGNFGGGGTTFTAPATGHYFFTAQHHCIGLSALNTFSFFQLITTGVDYELLLDSPFANSTGGELVRTGNAFVPMTAGDTAYTNLQIQGSGVRNVSLAGFTATSNRTTMFAGYQVL